LAILTLSVAADSTIGNSFIASMIPTPVATIRAAIIGINIIGLGSFYHKKKVAGSKLQVAGYRLQVLT
jgi:hypothetical protein